MNALAPPASRVARELVAWAEARLESVSASARLDAELLLAETAGIRRAGVIAHPERVLPAAEVAELAAVVERRSRGEPLAYIVGRKEFFSLALEVDASVLVPRPETELLVEQALAVLPRRGARVLDLGTGSGAIALAIKRERPGVEVIASDRSAAALAVARRNAARLDLDIAWLQSDWFTALVGRRFDLIVSNPPYVASADPHLEGEIAFEPREALDGGADGLDAYRAILAGAARHLLPGAKLYVEHGHDQREPIIALARAAGFAPVAAVDDSAGLPRVLGFVGSGND